MKSHILFDHNCSACGACADLCPQKAITLQYDEKGFLYPMVQENDCIECGGCIAICPCHDEKDYPMPEKAYIATGTDDGITRHSSSGGIFAFMAKEILSHGGIVYGAAMIIEGDNIDCQHVRIQNEEELYRIQGSKYVHSRTDGVFEEIKKLLTSGMTVLFSGTSCQVAALRNYLKKDYTNLYTIDLVCHGTPEITHLRKYTEYLSKRHRIQIHQLLFRNKLAVANHETDNSYVITLEGTDKNSDQACRILIPKNVSPYYALFFQRANYRTNCYCCHYASLQKPGDITLGDFIPSIMEINQYDLDPTQTYSSVFIRTSQGEKLFAMAEQDLKKVEISISEILTHHKNLMKPSVITSTGKMYKRIYETTGFAGLDIFLRIRNRMFPGGKKTYRT